jgi:SAM-dependent methyltransferase
MIPYNRKPHSSVEVNGVTISDFTSSSINADHNTVDSFGEEWNRFGNFSEAEIKRAGDQYFDIVTDKMLNKDSACLDIGCGSGRWSKYISSRAGFVEAVDPSDAVIPAVKLTQSCGNVRVTRAGYGCLPFEKESFDFVFSLGVVHHLPDTQAAISEAASMVKKNGWLLLYIYYSLDNRSAFYRFIFHCSDLVRRVISSMPQFLKNFFCDLIAVFVYIPFVGISKFVKLFSSSLAVKVPLSYYSDKPWKVIRNDSLDRFGTPLEKRFSKKEIEDMLKNAGMKDICFSDNEPYWHVVASK